MSKVSLFTVSDKRKKMLQTFYPEPRTPFSGAQRLSGLLEVTNDSVWVLNVTMKKLKLFLIVLSTAVYFALVLTTKSR